MGVGAAEHHAKINCWRTASEGGPYKGKKRGKTQARQPRRDKPSRHDYLADLPAASRHGAQRCCATTRNWVWKRFRLRVCRQRILRNGSYESSLRAIVSSG